MKNKIKKYLLLTKIYFIIALIGYFLTIFITFEKGIENIIAVIFLSGVLATTTAIKLANIITNIKIREKNE